MTQRAPHRISIPMVDVKLTLNEKLFLTLLLGGRTDAQIRKQQDWTNLQLRTIKRHLKKKLGYDNRTQLAVWWWVQTRSESHEPRRTKNSKRRPTPNLAC